MKKYKKEDKRSNLRGESLTKEILFIVAASPILLSALFMPNAAQMLKPLLNWHDNWDKIKKQRIYNAIKRLNKKRLVELVEKGDEVYIEITNNGKKVIKSFDYDNLILSRPDKWDKKWRMVIFDIPEKKKKERHVFSQKLKDLGFYPLQESVFVFPYDCRDEIDFICEFLSINRFVNYCLVVNLDKREGDLYAFFDFL